MDSLLKEKYLAYREIAKDGDIILTHSTKPIAKIIQNVDECYWHHSELVFWSYDRLMCIGAHPGDDKTSFLSKRFKQKKWDNFTVIRPRLYNKNQVQKALKMSFKFAELYEGYDFDLLLSILLYRIGLKNSVYGKDNKYICSEFTLQYMKFLGENIELERPFFTPEDHIRHLSSNFKVII